MKFVYHVTSDDIMTVIILAILLIMVLVCAVMIWYNNMKTKYKKWRQARKEKKNERSNTGDRKDSV